MTKIEWLVAFGDHTWGMLETVVNNVALGEPSLLEEDAAVQACIRFPDQEIVLVAIYCQHDLEEEE